MLAYRALTKAGVTTRDAAGLTGVARATAGRPVSSSPRRWTRSVPANRLTAEERAVVLATLNSAEFVDCTPVQIYATLLDRGTYLCSVSSMYRVLGEHAQVKDRRRLARHPARVRPELVATGPGQVFTWDITKLRGPNKGQLNWDVSVDSSVIRAHQHSATAKRFDPADAAAVEDSTNLPGDTGGGIE